MGLEIVAQVPDLDAVIVPVGGGGLLAGVSLAVKTLPPRGEGDRRGSRSRRQFSRRAECKETGHNSNPPDSRRRTLRLRRWVRTRSRLRATTPTKVVLVNEEQIALAILRIVELEKGVVEGAAATTLAACLSGQLRSRLGSASSSRFMPEATSIPMCSVAMIRTRTGRRRNGSPVLPR